MQRSCDPARRGKEKTMKSCALTAAFWLVTLSSAQQQPSSHVDGYATLDGSRVYSPGQRIQVGQPHGVHSGSIAMDDVSFLRPVSITETRREEGTELLLEGSLLANVRRSTNKSWQRESFEFRCNVPEPQVGETRLAFIQNSGELRIGESEGHCELRSIAPQSVPNSVAQDPPQIFIEAWQTVAQDATSVNAGTAVHYSFNVPGSTKILVEYRVQGGLDDKIRAFVVDGPNYQLYSEHRTFKQYSGQSGSVRGIGKYEIQVPQSGTYHLVLDNGNSWLLPRSVTFHVDAILPQSTQESEQLRTALETQYSLLKRIFIFPDFQTYVKHCGVVNAFSNPNITLCVELLEEMMSKGMAGPINFAYLHELGHTLMRQWGLPLWDNEDAADEFVTAFLLIGKQEAIALQAAQYWASLNTTQQDAVAKIWMDDRHSLSPQRARNIARWVKDRDEIVTRWERVFIPNMQTGVLQGMFRDPGVSDKSLVRSELRRRGISSPES
jgi:Putative metallopeptidase